MSGSVGLWTSNLQAAVPAGSDSSRKQEQRVLMGPSRVREVLVHYSSVLFLLDFQSDDFEFELVLVYLPGLLVKCCLVFISFSFLIFLDASVKRSEVRG